MCAPFLLSHRSIPVVSLSNKRQRAPQDESGLSISTTHLVESLVAIQGGHPHVFTRTIGKYPMLLTVSNQGAPHTHGLSSPHPPRGEPHQKTRWPPAPVRSCFSASLRKGAPSPRPPIARNSRSPKATATRMPTRGPRLLDRQGRFLGRLLPVRSVSFSHVQQKSCGLTRQFTRRAQVARIHFPSASGQFTRRAQVARTRIHFPSASGQFTRRAQVARFRSSVESHHLQESRKECGHFENMVQFFHH